MATRRSQKVALSSYPEPLRESGYDDAHDPEWLIFFEMLAAQGA